jgi:MFS family permease
MLNNHPLIRTLKTLRGNVRGCVYTEPLWGIPFNLYAPYVSIYMLSFGLTDSQIGLVTTLGLVCQIFWTLVSGAITDKLGRKRTTFIFDAISWSIPCIIWAVAQDVRYFFAAAVVNSLWRITNNSWQCLMVEDTEPELLVDVYSWIYISGLIAAFASPLAGLLIERYTLIPTMRGLYALAFVMMTAKFILTNKMVTETRQGRRRMQETRDQPLLALLRETPRVFKQILRTPRTMFVVGLMLAVNIAWMVRGTFWSILVTEKLQIPAQHLSTYAFARSIVMLLFYFVVMPRLRDMDARTPMLLGFLGLIASQVMLIRILPGHGTLLLVATILEACSVPTVSTLLDKLVVVNVDVKERARVMAVLYAMVLVGTSPFGWIAGQISEIDRSLPFVLNIALFVAGGLLTYLAGRLIKGEAAIQEPLGQASVA